MKRDDPRACVAAALHAHRRELARYVASRVPRADVDDVLQIAALRALEKAQDLRDTGRVLPWLYRIHGNAVTDMGRGKARDRRLIEALTQELAQEPAPDPSLKDSETGCGCSLVQVKTLHPNYAAILNLVDIAGVSLAQAASALSITVNNATVRLHRARAALKKRLIEHCGTTSLHACDDCRCVREGCCSG